MKSLITIFTISISTLIYSSALFSQSCAKYFKKGDCGMDLQRGYRVYSQSKSTPISMQDTVEFNVVFYGQKDYIFSFCTDKDLYPVNFRLYDPDSGELLYDNSGDRYLESLSIGFDVTRSLLIEVNVLAETSTRTDVDNFTGCLGVLFQYKNYGN